MRRKLVAYTGDNSNVIKWPSNRKSGNEWSMLLIRIFDRCELALEFRIFPLFISTFNNTECDNLARLDEDSVREYAESVKLPYIDQPSIFRFYTIGSFLRRIPLVHLDSDRWINFLHQLAEKRTFRSPPRGPHNNTMISKLGRGEGCW